MGGLSLHRVPRRDATIIINTMYVVFLGVLSTNMAMLDWEEGGLTVHFIFWEELPFVVKITCGALLIYFLFDWALWNALVKPRKDLLDVVLLANLLGIMSVPLLFFCALNLSDVSIGSVFVVFCVYSFLMIFRDDVVLIVAYGRALRREEMQGRNVATFLLVCLTVATKVLITAGLLISSVLLIAFKKQQQAHIESYESALCLLVVIYCIAKGVQYGLFSRFSPEM